MKIKGNNSNFEACPEFTGRAVCVDVTPLRKQASQYGERDVFKVVFEVDLQKGDGAPYCVWSRNFTPSLNEKASFRKFLRGWFGRDLTAQELSDFDTDSLIGKAAQVVVVHEFKDGETFANIAACTPHRVGDALVASGKYVRVQNRPAKDSNESAQGGYRRATSVAPEAAGDKDFETVKVHVGKCKGLELRDLSLEQVQAIVDNWLPAAKANSKPTADDKRLIAALDAWTAKQEKENDNVAF